jgi:hypothetical protein
MLSALLRSNAVRCYWESDSPQRPKYMHLSGSKIDGNSAAEPFGLPHSIVMSALETVPQQYSHEDIEGRMCFGWLPLPLGERNRDAHGLPLR